MKQRTAKLGFFILGLFVLAFIVTAALQPKAGKPAAFADGTTFEQAVAQSNETGKPVFVLATADWCRPCQHLKSTALRDERVEAAIRERTIPVYLDLTEQQSRTAESQVAREMMISSIPTMVLWRPDGELGRKVGTVPAVELLSWLESF